MDTTAIKRRIDEVCERAERVLDKGGTKKEVVFLVVSAGALIASFITDGSLLIDPAWVAIALCGVPIVCGAFIGLATEFDIKADLLVSIALVASVATGEYFAAGEVAAIMQLGGLLEELTAARARVGIERLVEMTPRAARVVGEDGACREMEACEVAVGDLVRILPGEAVPVDGQVVAGSTSVDESVVTGEPLPKDKQVGDTVSAGTMNRHGSIDVQVTRAGDDGTIARMARLVSSADAGKAKIVHVADKWATWVVVIALVAATGTYLVTGEMLRAVTVLVVFCPCAFVLATPAAIAAGIGNATRHGCLVKEGDALERLAQVDVVAFDKTGTLTLGKPQVSGLEPLSGSGLSRAELFALVASAEALSEHPLGEAIVVSAKAEGVEVVPADAFSMRPGLGVCALVAGREVAVGNPKLMESLGVGVLAWACEAVADQINNGATVSYVAVDGSPAGFVALADVPRPEAYATVAAVHELGVEPVMLTGDAQAAADNIASRLGIG